MVLPRDCVATAAPPPQVNCDTSCSRKDTDDIAILAANTDLPGPLTDSPVTIGNITPVTSHRNAATNMVSIATRASSSKSEKNSKFKEEMFEVKIENNERLLPGILNLLFVD